jgi:hypothetical protein
VSIQRTDYIVPALNLEVLKYLENDIFENIAGGYE